MTHAALRSDARANRSRLLSAATALFAEQGTEADIRDVAERAGLAVGTIYRHFPGKADLIAAVMEEAVREYGEAVDAGLAADDPIAGLAAFLRGGVAVIARYGELMAALHEGRAPDARSAAVRASRRARISERVAELIQKGVDAGALRADQSPELLAAFLRSAFVPWSLGELSRGCAPLDVADAFLDLFLHGAVQRPV